MRNIILFLPYTSIQFQWLVGTLYTAHLSFEFCLAEKIESDRDKLTR
jgi:hypothetical protein